MDTTRPQINAGIVTYRRAGASFEGTWSHEKVAGALEREII